MSKFKKVKTSFIKLLEKISQTKKEDFPGFGLLLYESSYFSNINSISLRPSIECPKNLYIDKEKTFNFLSEISEKSHPLHEGYHFFNEKGLLTHVSQYLVSLGNSNIIPNELHGARYLSAKIESKKKGVILTGVICSNYNIFYFDNGKSYEPSTQWENIYKEGGDKYYYYDIDNPHEDMEKVVKKFKDCNTKRVLDLGFGAGRNLIYLANKGFDVYGIDMTEEGMKISRKKFKDKGLKVDLKKGNVFEQLPYRDNFFDAIVSVQVLQHGSLNQIKNALSELKRVLRPGGLIFITLCGRYSKNKIRYCLVKTAKKIAPRTYVPTIGKEAGLIHYIYDKQTIEEHYKDFKIIDFWKDSKDYYCFIGRNKKK